DTPATGTLVATDIDSPTLTYSLVSTANAHGVVTITDVHTGAYSYTPDADYNGPASFTFKANDGSLDSNVAAVSITVTPVNDPPVVDVDTDDGTPNGSTAITVNEGNTAVQTGTFSDIDSSSVTITATKVDDSGHPVSFGTISQDSGASGTWTWTQPTTDDLAPTTVTITATDSNGAKTTTSFVFTVLNVAPDIVMSTNTITLAPG